MIYYIAGTGGQKEEKVMLTYAKLHYWEFYVTKFVERQRV